MAEDIQLFASKLRRFMESRWQLRIQIKSQLLAQKLGLDQRKLAQYLSYLERNPVQGLRISKRKLGHKAATWHIELA